MRIKIFLDKVAHVAESTIDGDDGMVYLSNYDDSYVTRVGMEKSIKALADREITDELTHGVGFSPKDGKWYGWSHRAIYGFEVGSTCAKGDSHYKAANLDDEIEDAIRFWDDENRLNTKAELIASGRLQVSWEYDDKTPNKKLRGQISGVEHTFDPDNFGRGEWVAKTMEDAKQMAIDFNEGVS